MSYFKGADSESVGNFSKFGENLPFLGKFGPKIKKCPVGAKNWYVTYFKGPDSESDDIFRNLGNIYPFWANLGQKLTTSLLS